MTISDTESNRLRLAEDITHEDGCWGIWEGCQYSIAKYIYQHMESATGPIGGGDSMVELTYGAANIEDTSGISLRQYKGKTRLEIMRDLADMDKSVFWVTLGGTTVTWKSTFNDGSPTAMTDATVIGWRSVFDWEPVYNEMDIYGARIGDTDHEGLGRFGPQEHLGTAPLSEAASIAKQVQDDLTDPRAVAVDLGEISRHVHVQVEPLCLEERLDRRGCGLDQRREGYPFLGEGHAAGLDLAQIEHVVD